MLVCALSLTSVLVAVSGNSALGRVHDVAHASIRWLALAVLGMSLVLEGVSLTVAIRAVRAGAEAAGLTFSQFVRRGMDPTSIAVMMEDAGAVAGLCIAGEYQVPKYPVDSKASVNSNKVSIHCYHFQR